MNIESITNMASFYAASADTAKLTNDAESFQSYLKNATEKEDTELREACLEFESYFINMMFKEMRSSISSSDSLIPKSNAQKIFEDMFYDEMSRSAAQQNSLGLANFMYKQLKAEQSANIKQAY